ncbi:MAG: type II secretion system protein GspE, partial [Smithellaceae bacterium]|nr:type II secretion system protein GspE [Smithellaceae bacterium]
TDMSPRKETAALGLNEDTLAQRGRGCEKCAGMGYYGRAGIFELLPVGDTVAKLILRNADASEIRQTARGAGMKTLLEDGLAKIRDGITTISEVLRVTQEE